MCCHHDHIKCIARHSGLLVFTYVVIFTQLLMRFQWVWIESKNYLRKILIFLMNQKFSSMSVLLLPIIVQFGNISRKTNLKKRQKKTREKKNQFHGIFFGYSILIFMGNIQKNFFVKLSYLISRVFFEKRQNVIIVAQLWFNEVVPLRVWDII